MTAERPPGAAPAAVAVLAGPVAHPAVVALAETPQRTYVVLIGEAAETGVLPGFPYGGSGELLTVDLDRCADERQRACADALHSSGSEPAVLTLRRHPGALVVVRRRTARTAEAVVRDGTRLAVTAAGPAPAGRRELRLLASLLHGWLAEGLPVEALRSVRFLGARHGPGQGSPAGDARFRIRSFRRRASLGLSEA
ncbi:hypothetical protein A6A06_02335 [Streptomyces sp. CB02923]|uniref:hypothetical protein n=1 Tax=Streptomyces sp. CB02923 TaxID=1718985 RepID=UPI00093CBAE8|nr:hypothetical protein [Streptomyces sp. CB02923]OKI09540.1 hypothetical protein A6A06_02335 [Streptomyces sp. CB02923]